MTVRTNSNKIALRDAFVPNSKTVPVTFGIPLKPVAATALLEKPVRTHKIILVMFGILLWRVDEMPAL
jgi:hypothetical protein